MARPVRRPAARSRVPLILLTIAAATSAAWFVTRGIAPPPPKVPDLPEAATSEPAPSPEPPKTEDERIERVLEVLFTGDPDDAMWARGVLLRSGEPARRAVAEAARRCLVSNRAFVEHAFDLLLTEPRAEDVPLALEAITNPDPEVVKRATLLLGRVGGPVVRENLQRIVDVASMSWPLPAYALDALEKLGGDDAVAQLERIVAQPDVLDSVKDLALSRIGTVGGPRARTRLLEELARTPPDATDRFIAVAEGLVALRDPAPVEQLRALWKIRRDERALTLLCRAADEVAFTEVESRLLGSLETQQRREYALALLDTFPWERRRPLLMQFLASVDDEIARTSSERARGPLRELRVSTWAALVRGSADVRDDVLRMLRADGRDDRIVASLVAGQIRDPAIGPALLVACRAASDDAELRTMILRAIVLVGDPAGAETVVTAMASDPSDHMSPNSLAYELALMIPSASRAFRDAAAPFVLRAIRGELGRPGPAAMGHLITVTAHCCGPEAAPVVEPFLVHDDRHLREAAAGALLWVAGPGTIAELRKAWWRRQDGPTRTVLRRTLQLVVLVRPVG